MTAGARVYRLIGHATSTVSPPASDPHRLHAMHEDPVSPEECLRSLAAEALRWAPHRPLFPDSLRLMAVANAFVMLGLLPEPRAEAALADHKSALEREGFGDTWGVTKGELTVRPGAHGYWQSRMAGPGGLRQVPSLVAAAGVCCPTSAAEVCFEWVKQTSTGWQLSFRATAPDPDPYADPPDPDAAMGQAMSQISLTDDAGRSHDLRAEAWAGAATWTGTSKSGTATCSWPAIRPARQPGLSWRPRPAVPRAGSPCRPRPGFRRDAATRRGRPRPSATWPRSRRSPPSRWEPRAP